MDKSYELMDDWINKQMNKWMDERTNEWTKKQMNEWKKWREKTVVIKSKPHGWV